MSKSIKPMAGLKMRSNVEAEDEETRFPIEKGDSYPGPVPVSKDQIKKYKRNKFVKPEQAARDAKHVQRLKQDKKRSKSAIISAIQSELLLTEESGYLEADSNEKSYQIRQEEIKSATDITSASKSFDLDLLSCGPYQIDYYRNGRSLILGGKKGHVAIFDWLTKRLKMEINVQEEIFDVKFLHLPSLLSVAQSTYVHIYDDQGIELHCLKNMFKISNLEFLPYHFLLVSGSRSTGQITYLDVSTGKTIISYRMFNLRSSDNVKFTDMKQNPNNAIIHTSHSNGIVNLWSPSDKKPLITILANASCINGLAINQDHYLATSGIDRSIKIWDLRSLKNNLLDLRLRSIPNKIDFSQKGLLAVSLGDAVEIYQDLTKLGFDQDKIGNQDNIIQDGERDSDQDKKIKLEPYMRHKLSRSSFISDVQFCNYEDVLGLGHARGFSSLIIPGSGEPNFDSFEANPFMTSKQRKEMEIKSLLDKIQPELITLDCNQLAQVNVGAIKEDNDRKKSTNYLKVQSIQLKRNNKRSKVKEVKIKQQIRDKRVQKISKQSIAQSLQSRIKKKGNQDKKNKSSSDIFSRFGNK